MTRRPGIAVRLREGGQLYLVLQRLLRELGRDVELGPEGTVAIQCLNPEAHKNADEHPSLVVKPKTGFVDCRSCSFSAGILELAVLAGHAATKAEAAAWIESEYLGAQSKQRRVVATYDYTDEAGDLLFQVRRFIPKAFSQRRPGPDGSWINDLKGIRRVLYRLPKVLEAVRQGRHVFIVEGERDTEAAEAAGLVATCNSGGAGKWDPAFAEVLRGVAVTVVADRDGPGRRHAKEVAKSLTGIASSVRTVEAAAGKDLTDHLAAGHRVDDLVPVDLTAPKAANTSSNANADDDERSRASVTVDLFLGKAPKLFHDREEAFAHFAVGGHGETYAIRSQGFALYLRNLFFHERGDALSDVSTRNAVSAIEAIALFQGPSEKVHLRVALVDAELYLHLGDPDWRAVRVRADGWEVVEDPPVKFRRPQGMLALPAPERGGKIDELREFVNVATENDWRLLIVWLVSCLWPTGPYAVLAIYGEQGAAKSTVARMLRRLLDPNRAELRKPPRHEDDLIIAANNGLVALDNLSDMPAWLSDEICRLASGEGLGKRRLFTDLDEILVDVQRPVLFTAIESIATRGDLVDRAISITLPAIPDGQRRDEKTLWADFERARPRILAGLLDALSSVIRNLPGVRLDRLPRMADFARLATAAEEGLGWPKGTAVAAYFENIEAAYLLALEASPVGIQVREFAKDLAAPWEGTAEKLLEALDGKAPARVCETKSWPKTPRGLSGQLRRVAPLLRRVGVLVELDRRSADRNRDRLIVIHTEGRAEKGPQPSTPSAPSAPSTPRPPDSLFPDSPDGADGADGQSLFHAHPDGDRDPWEERI